MFRKTNRKKCLFVLLLWLPLAVHCQPVHSLASNPYMDCSGYSRGLNDLLAASGNPAALAGLKRAAFGLYAENRFMLKELASIDVVVAVPAGFSVLGIKARYSGSTVYAESDLGLLLAKKLGQKLDIGVGIDYSRIHMSGYADINSMQTAVGVFLHPTERINIGIHLQNPWSAGPGREKWATAFRLGLGYDISPQLCFAADIGKQEGLGLEFRFCLLYAFAEKFQARFGVISAFPSPFAGAGWTWKSMRLDICCRYHPLLGFSPALVLIMQLAEPHNK